MKGEIRCRFSSARRLFFHSEMLIAVCGHQCLQSPVCSVSQFTHKVSSSLSFTIIPKAHDLDSAVRSG